MQNISLTEEQIEEIRKDPDNQNWEDFNFYKKSEDFIREFENKVDWFCISCEETLSEEFIREFQDKVYWSRISYFQKLSKEFIVEFQNKIVFKNLLKNENISDEIKELCKTFL